ncbi:MAG: hypothetical protein EBQ71_06885, partial [Betaproteobacteria bacterium]|nr:hypothetical protein [Betaproteobacteria bacterium]
MTSCRWCRHAKGPCHEPAQSRHRPLSHRPTRPYPARSTHSFSFDGRNLEGYRGETVAATLLAHGIHLVGRSFKYHRPRGILAAGIEEP